MMKTIKYYNHSLILNFEGGLGELIFRSNTMPQEALFPRMKARSLDDNMVHWHL